MKIFVQIAAYRDPQLIPTIENMLENANKKLTYCHSKYYCKKIYYWMACSRTQLDK